MDTLFVKARFHDRCLHVYERQTSTSNATQLSKTPGNGHVGAPISATIFFFFSAAIDADELDSCELSAEIGSHFPM